ncbi:hypothetical protein HYC85_030798 [Camellia sinensis]|uniref:Uncharacterized protein n=1 Tax=Camellia sinensis TaxID=4442 RepID=A0A7J7G2A5_CAMSI|nr:hypothetical protein HYC85_030798 [Camellia sinensis]
MMTTRHSEKDQVRMVVCNLQGKLLQKMIVLPLFTIIELYEIGVQIEDAMKQGLITDEKEKPKRTFTRSSNATMNGSTTAQLSDANVVATTPKTANLFTNTNPQTSNSQAQSQRVFTPLYMPLSKALGVLIKKGHLKPLRLEIQDLIDNKVIAPPQKPNVTTNPLPTHNQVPLPQNLNLIHTLVIPYDPSVYITASHLPKPAMFIPESTNLCMMDTSILQPEHVVVTVAEEGRLALEKSVSPLLESSTDLPKGVYDPCHYIVPVDQAKPKVVLPTAAEVNMVREDGPSQGLDDLAELEEDSDNLQFYDEQDQEDVQID